ncbi:MAG: UDP-glucose 6-dehydrogenase [Euryarchaeota archaeon]|nr:UDP-glucose 6-dehydrogenase [Euryarchaeota archaeon]
MVEFTKISVIGTWHLGSVYSACLAELGYHVVGVDKDEQRIRNLNKGLAPIFEPGLNQLIAKNIGAGKLEYSTDLQFAVRDTYFIFITYDTAVDDNDDIDLTELYKTINSLAPILENGSILIVSSQVPVGTCDAFEKIISDQNPQLDFDIAYVPENLRLGQAISRFMNAERIVIGANRTLTLNAVEELFHNIGTIKVKMDLKSAEMTKHALNAFLATSISFINEIANISDQLGVDALKVAEAIKLDSRIGPNAMLKPGLGFSGGTLARDVKVLNKLGIGNSYSTELLNAVLRVNQQQNQIVIKKLEGIYGSISNITVSVFGLTYKAGTSTLRRSVSLEIIHTLSVKGAKIKAYDPHADPKEIKNTQLFDMFDSPLSAAENSDALIFITEWPEFRKLDFSYIKSTMKHPVVIDAQNMLDGEFLTQMGFVYCGIGRGNKMTKLTVNSEVK